MSAAAIVANPNRRDVVDQLDHHSSSHHAHSSSSAVRSCEFCGSCTTPTWRRGPSGKGSLCNACGIKWRLKKRTNKKDGAPEAVVANKKQAKSKKQATGFPSSPIPTITKKKDNNSTATHYHSNNKTHSHDLPKKTTAIHHINNTNNNNNNNNSQLTNKERPAINPDSNDKRYYCKFCDQTFASTHFKNSQQFGAHCSNCSRRPHRHHPSSSTAHHHVEPVPSPFTEEDDDEMADIESEYMDEEATHQGKRTAASIQSPEGGNSSGDEASSRVHHHADDLLNHLLHVVANQLVEENELTSIRAELSMIKEEMHQQKDLQQSSLLDLGNQLHRDVEEVHAMIAEDARQKQRIAAAQLCELDNYWRDIHQNLEQHLFQLSA